MQLASRPERCETAVPGGLLHEEPHFDKVEWCPKSHKCYWQRFEALWPTVGMVSLREPYCRVQHSHDCVFTRWFHVVGLCHPEGFCDPLTLLTASLATQLLFTQPSSKQPLRFLPMNLQSNIYPPCYCTPRSVGLKSATLPYTSIWLTSTVGYLHPSCFCHFVCIWSMHFSSSTLKATLFPSSLKTLNQPASISPTFPTDPCFEFKLCHRLTWVQWIHSSCCLNKMSLYSPNLQEKTFFWRRGGIFLVVKILSSLFPLQGGRVPSLVRELRSPMPVRCSWKKKRRKKGCSGHGKKRMR